MGRENLSGVDGKNEKKYEWNNRCNKRGKNDITGRK